MDLPTRTDASVKRQRLGLDPGTECAPPCAEVLIDVTPLHYDPKVRVQAVLVCSRFSHVQ
jgi:hypothetical protein